MTLNFMVTGASGFLGSRLVECLAKDKSISIFATFRDRTDRLMSPVPTNVQYTRCDLSSQVALTSLFSRARFSAVIHTAAVIPTTAAGDFEAIARDNLVAPIHLISAARTSGVSRFIFCSSISVYEPFEGFSEDAPLNPLSIYARSKYIGEQILKMAAGERMVGISLRLAGLHGPGRANGVVHHMVSAAHKHAPILVTEPNSRFRLCFIDDAIEAVLKILHMPTPPRHACYNIAGRDIFTLRMLAERIRFLTASSSEIREAPSSPVRNMVMPILRAECDLDYRPRGLDEHLREMIARVGEGE
ncbi:MAG: NAD-dependent epimerase/dehydratase family protein [Alphaproteobacteria bacterium]